MTLEFKKKNYKRSECTNDSSDMKQIKNKFNKCKIKYPKN